MRAIQGLNTPADADIRRALSEYHAARYRASELKRQDPPADEPSEIRQDFERQTKASVKAEQEARATLSSAVEAFSGAAPCAVIVESRGGSSVIAVSGKPDGMIIVTAADRIHIKEVLCRPEPPPEFAHQFRQMAPSLAGSYLVTQGSDLMAIYNGVYFRSTNEVVADLQELIQAGLEAVWSDDYVIWCDGRVMAVIHQPMDGHEQKLFLFNEPRNDPIGGRAINPMPYWPKYEEWVERGRGDLWKTDRYP
jgi:hypothetical protein